LIFVEEGDESRFLRARLSAEEIFVVAIFAEGDDGVGGFEDGLDAAVVLLEFEDLCLGEGFREVEDVVDGGGSEGVDGLCVVAYDG
jgi:hypothetical protein